jgi:hypothetical protein
MVMMTARVFLKNRSSFIDSSRWRQWRLEKMKASTITAYHHIIIIINLIPCWLLLSCEWWCGECAEKNTTINTSLVTLLYYLIG